MILRHSTAWTLALGLSLVSDLMSARRLVLYCTVCLLMASGEQGKEAPVGQRLLEWEPTQAFFCPGPSTWQPCAALRPCRQEPGRDLAAHR